MSDSRFRPYRGIVLKSRDGIPSPARPPRGIDLANEARTARQRFYPVTLVYTTYALTVIAAGLRTDGRTAVLFIAGAAACWTSSNTSCTATCCIDHFRTGRADYEASRCGTTTCYTVGGK